KAAYYLANHVDSVKVVTDDTGKALSRTEYLPYGETFQQEGDIRFTAKYNGQALDEESDLYYYNARHYDPEIGRFVTADSVTDGPGTIKGWNRYMYVGGNPIMYKDPTGHEGEHIDHMTQAERKLNTASNKVMEDYGGSDQNQVEYGLKEQLMDRLLEQKNWECEKKCSRARTVTIVYEGKTLTINFKADFSNRAAKENSNWTPEAIIGALDNKVFGVWAKSLMQEGVYEVDVSGVGRPHPRPSHHKLNTNAAIDFNNIKWIDSAGKKQEDSLYGKRGKTDKFSQKVADLRGRLISNTLYYFGDKIKSYNSFSYALMDRMKNRWKKTGSPEWSNYRNTGYGCAAKRCENTNGTKSGTSNQNLHKDHWHFSFITF
ncbi:MAG: RHS repeat-associated core domain-containing protein, partial [Leptospirales bacterium]